MPAVSHQAVHVDDAIRRLPYLTVHVVELPDRLWVADPESLTCWVHRDAEPQQRGLWVAEAGTAILAARPDLTPEPGPRLRSVGR